MDSSNEMLVRQIRTRVRSFMRRTDTHDLNLFVKDLEKRGCRVALFGGTIRDLILQQAPRFPRDVDLVVEGGDADLSGSFLRQTSVRRNRFGGFNIRMSHYMVDVWRLSDTWGFRHVAAPPTFSTLPLTTFLNAEAIAVELGLASGGNGVFDSGFISAVSKKTLEINLAENPYPELCAVRAIHLAHRTGFSLGSRLSDFIRRVLGESSFESLLQVQRHHYGKVVLDGTDLNRLHKHFADNGGTVDLSHVFPMQGLLPLTEAIRIY